MNIKGYMTLQAEKSIMTWHRLKDANDSYVVL